MEVLEEGGGVNSPVATIMFALLKDVHKDVYARRRNMGLVPIPYNAVRLMRSQSVIGFFLRPDDMLVANGMRA